jgi:hypothetical protein
MNSSGTATAERSAITDRSLPKLLQSRPEIMAHLRCYMAVDTTYARHFVPYCGPGP